MHKRCLTYGELVERAKIKYPESTGGVPVTSRVQAIEKLQWYALRWKIETFHKILKSGCQAEQSKLRTAERLVNLHLANLRFRQPAWRLR